jgi:hypothetical protein
VTATAEAPHRWLASRPLRARVDSRLTLADGSQVSLRKGTELTLAGLAPVTLRVERGELFCQVTRAAAGGDSGGTQTDRGRFVVATPHLDAVVTGTEFGVEVTRSQTEVAVAAGEVRCRNEAGDVAVTAGMGTRARAGRAPRKPRPADADAAFAWRERLDPPEAVVFRYDFEAGRPGEWDQGRADRGPARGANRGSLATTPDTLPDGVAIHLNVPAALQTRPGRRVLRFRYHLPPGTRLALQFKNEAYGDNCKFLLADPAHGRWERVELPLDQFLVHPRGRPDPNQPIRGGDRLTFLQIMVVDGDANTVAWFDDIELIER